MTREPTVKMPGFLGLLGLLFIGLKLGAVIAWPWYVVLLPIYLPFAVAAVCLCSFVVLAAIAD